MIETKKEQERVKNSIDMFFTPPDPKIARTSKVARLREIFDYLDTVRADEYSLLPQKAAWIRSIADLSLADIVIDQILITPEQQWDANEKRSRGNFRPGHAN